jgi:hypothetical protein
VTDTTLRSGNGESVAVSFPKTNKYPIDAQVRVIDTAGNDVYYCGQVTGKNDNIDNSEWTRQDNAC